MKKVVIFFKISLILVSTYPWLTEALPATPGGSPYASEITSCNRLIIEEAPDTPALIFSFKTFLAYRLCTNFQMTEPIRSHTSGDVPAGAIVSGFIFSAIKAKAP